jgi:uncharacterized membrane protein YhiD involved in acid resistance
MHIGTRQCRRVAGMNFICTLVIHELAARRRHLTRLMRAMLLGALIGVERHCRRRVAGSRTNAMVVFGAAAFAELSSSRIGRRSRNGYGRDHLVSAAVAAFSGAGALLEAVFVTFVLVTINLSCPALIV